MEKVSFINHELRKKQYFTDLTFRYLPAMRLLVKEGKLSKKDQWRNVFEHCVAEVAVAEVMAESIGLSEEEKERLCVVAACHDWNKHLEKKPEDFTEEEVVTAEEYLNEVNPDRVLMDATKPVFMEKNMKGKDITFLEKLQFYIDNICKGSEVVTFNERIDEVSARSQDNIEISDFQKRYGVSYWEKEREVGREVEKEVFRRLKDRHVDILNPEQIPLYLKELIKEKIEKGVDNVD